MDDLSHVESTFLQGFDFSIVDFGRFLGYVYALSLHG
jgi:hypothetical protein